MPGPVYVPGATITSRPPPKPVVRPWVSVPDLAGAADAPVLPANVTEAWRGLWHALGSNLPYYVNHSRSSRKALRAMGRTHG